MEEAKIIKKIDLQITTIVVEAVVPSRFGYPGSPLPEHWENGGLTDQKVTFIVDTTTWKCKGQLATNDPVLTDEAWWADQCQRVSDRVRSQIKSTAA